MADKQIVVATTNVHKIAEISAIVGAFGYTAISRADAGVPDDFDVEEDGKTFEDNSLLKARAVFDLLGGRVAVAADDSGLCVDALGGAPGVYSARYARAEQDFAAADADLEQMHRSRQDRANNAKLLRLLSTAEYGDFVPAERRTARFVSVVTLILPVGSDSPSEYRGEDKDDTNECRGEGRDRESVVLVCRGDVEGHIVFSEFGPEGFGYDPLFAPLYSELQSAGLEKYGGLTFGLIPAEDKNKISHRFRALEKLRAALSECELPQVR
jgi:XTP/dITP diphosphohydrolase